MFWAFFFFNKIYLNVTHVHTVQNKLTASEDFNSLGIVYAYEYRCIEIKEYIDKEHI